MYSAIVVDVLSGAKAFAPALIVPVVLQFEVQRRFGVSFGDCVRHSKRVLSQCIPEAMCLTASLVFATVLRMMPSMHRPSPTLAWEDPKVGEAVWAEILKEWPILVGADTLLGLQAILRLVILVSVVSRASKSGPGPLAGMPAALALGGSVARGMLATRSMTYMLDGPLGGELAVVCELALVPLLAARGLTHIYAAPLAMMLATGVATYVASRNYLSLCEDRSANILFILAHCFELLSAFAYLFRTLILHSKPSDCATNTPVASVGFMHLLMSVQQALAAYYFLTVFEPDPKLVGAGRPFCLLILGNLAQLFAYLGAAALHFADGPDGTDSSSRQDESTMTGITPGMTPGLTPAMIPGMTPDMTPGMIIEL